ncbi:helix-turn-helix transcriptional regulator [Paeniglutamicibacter antarcticus]|uniref:Helix-turn-helix transcriptional regulator n=1 Tax=Arthrobacter terrae TaxID=2935737 RepID=A0A931CRP9_9MICC|nr:helix-turn-helix transcriptional regulator [Arthrobacter terrae]MBG0741200.1 helix-turn-helix transcriptional regulator [Arthrobacter terrae]
MRDRSGENVELGLSYELCGISDSDAFFAATSAMLVAVFHCDGATWNHLDLDRQSAVLRGTPAELEKAPVASLLAHHARDHPIIQSYLASPSFAPRRMSDLASQVQLQRTGSYSEVLRPLGIHFQLSMLTVRFGRMTGDGWVLNRVSRDFTDDDMELAPRVQAMLSLLTCRGTGPEVLRAGEAQAASGLTDRELEVLQLIAGGLTAVAVSRVLRIAPATVRKHLERVYAKLGTHDRLLAVHRGQTLGLLTATRADLDLTS